MNNRPFDKDLNYSRRVLMAGALGAGATATASQVSGAPLGFSFGANAFQPGFNLSEAQTVLQMCNYIYGGTPTPLKPPNWDVIYDPPQLPPFDNKWQLWKMRGSGGPYAIIIRGTVDETGSVAQDLLSLLMEANGNIGIDGFSFPYNFANEPNAAVHLGFALGALLLLKTPFVGILDKLSSLNIRANTPIYIGGHSQGAAVATLIRSYLYYAKISYQYKSYVFAQPKPGNDHYATDFENLFSNAGYAFRMTNSLDWVPQVPFTLEFPGDLNKPNPLDPNSDLATGLASCQAQTRALLLQKESPRMQKAGLALLRTKKPLADVAFSVDVPLVSSLYFTGAGTEMALIGQPCNLSPAQCNEWFQHHLSTYSALMQQQLKSVERSLYATWSTGGFWDTAALTQDRPLVPDRLAPRAASCRTTRALWSRHRLGCYANVKQVSTRPSQSRTIQPSTNPAVHNYKAAGIVATDATCSRYH
jgi:hypothetical protein